MLSNVSHTTLYVKDQNESLRFYTEKLGFEVRADVTQGDFRWLSVGLKNQPDFELVLFALRSNGTFLSDDDVKTLTHLLDTGKLGGMLMKTDDIQATYEEFKARGVEFVKEPTKEFYAIEAIFKDNEGRVISLHQANQ